MFNIGEQVNWYKRRCKRKPGKYIYSDGYYPFIYTLSEDGGSAYLPIYCENEIRGRKIRFRKEWRKS